MNHAMLVESCTKYESHTFTMVWSSWVCKVHLGGHFGHYCQNIEAESLINLSRYVLWSTINIVARITIMGFFFGTGLVKPNSGQTTMGWSTSIRLVIGHLGSKVHIEDPD